MLIYIQFNLDAYSIGCCIIQYGSPLISWSRHNDKSIIIYWWEQFHASWLVEAFNLVFTRTKWPPFLRHFHFPKGSIDSKSIAACNGLVLIMQQTIPWTYVDQMDMRELHLPKHFCMHRIWIFMSTWEVDEWNELLLWIFTFYHTSPKFGFKTLSRCAIHTGSHEIAVDNESHLTSFKVARGPFY